MRKFEFLALALPLLASAADVKMVGMGYRGGEAVKAGEELTLTITNATEVGSGYPGRVASSMRIVIWNSIYMWDMCSLTGIIPAKDGNISVTIPPEMGPSGMYYLITADGYDGAESDSWSSIISGKNTPFFYLTGGTGSWTPAETTPELKYGGLVGFDNADIPCKSYPCAQACATKYFPVTSGWQKGSDWYNCLTACEGVTINAQGIGSSSSEPILVNTTLATPKEECREDELQTKCGEECCSSMEYCSSYTVCAELPLKLGDRPKTSTSIPTPTANGNPSSPQGTGSANAMDIDWKVLGVAAGAMGIFKLGI